MLSKNQIKFIRALHLKKERESRRQFLVEGSKGVLEAAAGPFQIEGIYALSGWIEEYGRELASKGLQPEPVTVSEMERMTAMTSPSPALAILKMADSETVPQPADHSLSLVLDEIQDPGNLGTIIRIADWYGIRRIICSPGTVEFYNPKVIQSTMGSFCRVRVYYHSLPEFLGSLPPSVKIYGTFVEGQSIYSRELSAEGYIVIGNESRGISSEVEKLITDKISIPSYAFDERNEGHAESLNAAIAAAIVCAEFRRREEK